MQNAGLRDAQAGIKISRRKINHLRYADDTTLMAEGEEKLKSFSMSVKEVSEKANLKLNIKKSEKHTHTQNPKIMASSYTTSWQIEEE